MSVFDDILTTAKNAADVVGKKAIQVKDISRLRLSIIELNKEIGRNFEALGRLVYDAGKSGNSYDVDDSVAAIDELYEELSILSDEMNRLRGRVVCPCCGKENTLDATFCSKCGNRLPEQEKAEEKPEEEEPVQESPVTGEEAEEFEEDEQVAPAAEAPRAAVEEEEKPEE